MSKMNINTLEKNFTSINIKIEFIFFKRIYVYLIIYYKIKKHKFKKMYYHIFIPLYFYLIYSR